VNDCGTLSRAQREEGDELSGSGSAGGRPGSSGVGGSRTPLSLGGLLDATFDLLRAHAVVLVGLALAGLLAAVLLAAGVLVPLLGLRPGVAPDPTLLQRPAALASLALAGVAVVLTTLWATAALTHAADGAHRGTEVDAVGAVRAGLACLLPLIGTLSLVATAMGVAVAVPALAFAAAGGPVAIASIPVVLVLAIWLGLRFFLVTPIVVLEGLVGIAAVRRSFAMMRGQVGRIFLVSVVVALVSALLAFAAGLVGAAAGAVETILGFAVQTIVYAFTTTLAVVIYHDLRLRRGESGRGVPPTSQTGTAPPG
jgi:hypothetical protein